MAAVAPPAAAAAPAAVAAAPAAAKAKAKAKAKAAAPAPAPAAPAAAPSGSGKTLPHFLRSNIPLHEHTPYECVLTYCLVRVWLQRVSILSLISIKISPSSP